MTNVWKMENEERAGACDHRREAPRSGSSVI